MEEWETVAVIFRLSRKVLTAAPSAAEGQVSSTYSLISGVRLSSSAYPLLATHIYMYLD